MKKINFNINKNEYFIFIEKKYIQTICNLSGSKEKGGYIFVDKIKDTNEYIIKKITPPHKKDFMTYEFIKFSREHQKIAKKIKKLNPYLYEIGFYHTHPQYFGCQASSYDRDFFYKISLKYKLSLFIIGINEKVNIFIYSKGQEIKKEVIWK